MSFKHFAASRLLPVIALATVTLATVAEAQMNGPDQGQGGYGNMMGGNWGWGMGSGMGGFGGIGIIVLGLVVVAIAVLAIRRRTL